MRVSDRFPTAELGSRRDLTSQLGGERGLTTGDFAIVLGVVTAPALLLSFARLFRRLFIMRNFRATTGLESPDSARRRIERLHRYASRRRTVHEASLAEAADLSAGSAPKDPTR